MRVRTRSLKPPEGPRGQWGLTDSLWSRAQPWGIGLAPLAFISSTQRQDGYPPPVFRRLDQYIQAHGYRARDVFLVLDHDSSGRLSADELLSGFHRIDFQVRKEGRKDCSRTGWSGCHSRSHSTPLTTHSLFHPPTHIQQTSGVQLSKREEKSLRDWMQQIVGHHLSFKDFALALKQRASLTSPYRVSILQLAKH